MRYRFIREQRGRFRVRTMCRVLGVSRGGFYDWCRRPESARSVANRQLLERIRSVHRESRDNAGALKTWRRLRAQGETCGRHRVARLRRVHGIEARRMRRFRAAYATRKTEPAGPNLLDQQFTVDRPDEAWVGDITFVATRRGWLYLAVLIDLYARRVVGWSMSERINEALVRDAMAMAIHRRRPVARADPSQRPGRAVPQCRLSAAAGGTRDRGEHEPQGELPRQCMRRELLQHAEKRTDMASRLRRPRRSAKRRVRLYRDLLQPKPRPPVPQLLLTGSA